MRQPLIRRAQPGLARALPVSLPAPFGGINGVDGLDGGMQPFDAIDLVNWIAVDGGVETRPGYRIAADLGTGAPVGFVQEFDDGTKRTIAASDGKLFRIGGSPLAVAEIGIGLGSDLWSQAIMNRRLFLVNGETAPRAFFENALMTPAFTKDPAETADLDVTKLFRVRAHAKRLFFAEKGSPAFWYTAAPGNVQGALQRFDLSGVGNNGGVLADIATITPDGAREGDDDAIVFFMSSGDAIMYRGSAPNDAAGWARVGVFTTARLLASLNYAGDVLTASADGYGELSRVLPSGRSPIAGFGRKPGAMVKSAVSRFGARPGWQIAYDAARALVIVHVPQTERFCEQHVMNAVTGAWTRWTDLPAVSWGMIGGAMGFGTRDGKVAVLAGANDAGRAIVARGQGSWQALGAPGRIKKVNAARPVVVSDGQPAIGHIIAADFAVPSYPVPSRIGADQDVGVWDAAVWDAAIWGGGARVNDDLRGGGAIGRMIAVGLRADTMAAPLKWLSTSLMVEGGRAA